MAKFGGAMKAAGRKFTSAFKARVAVEAFKGRESIGELPKRFEANPNMTSWRRQELINQAKYLFLLIYFFLAISMARYRTLPTLNINFSSKKGF